MLQDDLKRLAEEIATAHEERMNAMDQLRQDTNASKVRTLEFVSTLGENRKSMAQEMRAGFGQLRENRKEDVSKLCKAARDMLNDFSSVREKSARKLWEELENFSLLLQQYKTDLDASESDRREKAQAEIEERKKLIAELSERTKSLLKEYEGTRKEISENLKASLQALRESLKEFKAGLEGAEAERKKNVQAELQETAKSVRDMLADVLTGLRHFMEGLDAAEEERKKSDRSELEEVAAGLRGRLSEFRSSLTGSVSTLLGELNADRSNAVRVWKEILSAVRSGGTGVSMAPVEVAAEEKAGTVEEVFQSSESSEKENVSEPVAEEAGEPLPAEEENVSQQEGMEWGSDFEDRILELLRERPQGLKMVEIAEELGLANWRSLIPVIRELLENGDVRKEDSSYFTA